MLLALALHGSASENETAAPAETIPEPWYTPRGISPSAAATLEGLGIEATTGAAAGYVDDRLCSRCHGDIARTYEEVGMSRSFFRPSAERAIEDFENNRFVHRRSGNIYEMEREDDKYLFRRFRIGANGEPILHVEQEIDWILGSGHRSRTYLYTNPAGELYQLPLAWYTQTNSWGMAPGFDKQRHFGIHRLVRRECMFCHNAYPEVPAGSDVYHAHQSFPTELPQGIGCQRCHGPGGEHVAASFDLEAPPESLEESIVNPGKLSSERIDDVCNQCHLQPSVALARLRRFDRNDYSFRPGEDLGDYLVHADSEETIPQPERFEINHHPYRLRQSPCFIESAGAMTCLTCHDPHRKVPVAERAAHYRAACLSCHTMDSCQLEEMTASNPQGIDPNNCVGCHMQQRRPQDVVLVTMTDHFIRRTPGGEEFTAPREEGNDPLITDIHLLDPRDLENPARAGSLRALIALGAGSRKEAVEYLEGGPLAQAAFDSPVPWMRLLRGQMQAHHFDTAEQTLAQIRRLDPNSPVLWEWGGIVKSAWGKNEEALELLKKGTVESPKNPVSFFNRGRLLVGDGRAKEALPDLERALELRPTFPAAWQYMAEARRALNQPEPAVEAYRRCLAMEPIRTSCYEGIAETLESLGRREEAIMFLRSGISAVEEPQSLMKAFERLVNAPRDSPAP